MSRLEKKFEKIEGVSSATHSEKNCHLSISIKKGIRKEKVIDKVNKLMKRYKQISTFSFNGQTT